jgi:hypothetical protein
MNSKVFILNCENAVYHSRIYPKVELTIKIDSKKGRETELIETKLQKNINIATEDQISICNEINFLDATMLSTVS